MERPCRLGVIASHFIQYQVPLWRKLANRPELDLKIYYLSDHGIRPGMDCEFGEVFQWDINMETGYDWELLPGAAGKYPGSFHWWWNPWPSLMVLRDKADVFLGSGYSSFGALAFFYSSLIKGMPVLYRGETTLLHENKSRARLKRIILKPVFSRRVYALAIGKLSSIHAKTLGVPEHRIIFSPYSVDSDYWEEAAREYSLKQTQLRRKYGLPEKVPVVLFCGKIIEKKRPLDLAHAMCQLIRKRSVSFLVAGTGEQLVKMKAIVAGCPKLTTHFAGFVNQTLLPQIYSAADILSLPSSGTETWGLVVNEGMYFGCVPVVSEQVGCGPDLVEGVGEIHPVGDIKALAASINRVLDELSQRKKLIAPRIEKYSLDKAADAIVEAALLAAG